MCCRNQNSQTGVPKYKKQSQFLVVVIPSGYDGRVSMQWIDVKSRKKQQTRVAETGHIFPSLTGGELTRLFSQHNCSFNH